MLLKVLERLVSEMYVELPKSSRHFSNLYIGQFGSYHYISGVDASSSASLAAYINSLTYAIEDSSAWFSKTATWKLKNGCYWCVLSSTSRCRI